MSNDLALRVANSQLPAHLKQTAIVMALYGHDDGDSIYPGLPLIAKGTSKSMDSIKRDIRVLRAVGILKPGSIARGIRQPGLFGHGGKGRTNLYRLDIERLAAVTLGEIAKATQQSNRGTHAPVSQAAKGGVDAPVLNAKGGVDAGQRGASTPAKGGVDAGISPADPCTDCKDSGTDCAAAAEPPPAGAPPARHPAGPGKSIRNAGFHQLSAIAYAWLRDHPQADDGELIDHLKYEASRLGIDRFAGEPDREDSSRDVVQRVADSELFKFRTLNETRRKLFGAQGGQ